MLPDDPRHGTYRGAQAHWREDSPTCKPCRLAANRYRKRRKYDADRNIPRIVDAQETRDHIKRLGHAGMTDAAIADRAGLSRTTIQHVRVGRYTQVLSATAEAVLGVGVTPHPKGWVSDLGSRRRTQALAALGWSKEAISTESAKLDCKVTTGALSWIAQSRSACGRVRVETRDAITAVYDALSMRTPAPSRGATLTRSAAAKAGHAPPLAWDDIDDPTAVPHGAGYKTFSDHDSNLYGWVDESRVQRVLNGDYRIRCTAAEKRLIVARWKGSLADLEGHTGWQACRYSTRGDAA